MAWGEEALLRGEQNGVSDSSNDGGLGTHLFPKQMTSL
jgi:hypothetical protein